VERTKLLQEQSL